MNWLDTITVAMDGTDLFVLAVAVYIVMIIVILALLGLASQDRRP